MKWYEWVRWFCMPLMTVHLQTVRKDILELVKKSRDSSNQKFSILDVGGRKSPYTIGIKAEVTLLDIPQEEGTRTDLNLGFTSEILESIKEKRSNIASLVVQDMVKSKLKDESYDAVVCVEVIEHVSRDNAFVENISKVIKKGGWAYFTTPNGDFIKNEGPNKNKDHIRHYTKLELSYLLERYFEYVEIKYAVSTGKYRVMGLKGFDKKRPFRIFSTIIANRINKLQSKNMHNISQGTAHLMAVCRK